MEVNQNNAYNYFNMNIYSAIYFYETKLQKRIVDYIINRQLFDNTNYLIIDASGHDLSINGNVYKINFNKINKIFQSLINLNKIKRLNIIGSVLIGTHITGLNAQFISSNIKANKKIIIDDGIGTPVLLCNPNIFKRKIKYQLRYNISKIAVFFMGMKLLSVKRLYHELDEYITVYKNLPATVMNNFKVIHIDLLNVKYIVRNGKVGFVGMPLVDFKIIKQNKFIEFLHIIKNTYGNFEYYLHPDEKFASTLLVEGVDFIKPNNALENYFAKTGLPEKLIGFASSVLLNVSTSIHVKTNLYYVKTNIYGREYDSLYYKLLENNNILYSGIKLNT